MHCTIHADAQKQSFAPDITDDEFRLIVDPFVYLYNLSYDNHGTRTPPKQTASAVASRLGTITQEGRHARIQFGQAAVPHDKSKESSATSRMCEVCYVDYPKLTTN